MRKGGYPIIDVSQGGHNYRVQIKQIRAIVLERHPVAETKRIPYVSGFDSRKFEVDGWEYYSYDDGSKEVIFIQRNLNTSTKSKRGIRHAQRQKPGT